MVRDAASLCAGFAAKVGALLVAGFVGAARHYLVIRIGHTLRVCEVAIVVSPWAFAIRGFAGCAAGSHCQHDRATTCVHFALKHHACLAAHLSQHAEGPITARVGQTRGWSRASQAA